MLLVLLGILLFVNPATKVANEDEQLQQTNFKNSGYDNLIAITQIYFEEQDSDWENITDVNNTADLTFSFQFLQSLNCVNYYSKCIFLPLPDISPLLLDIPPPAYC